MSRILADAAAYGRQYLRSKIGAFFTFIFPILLILLFGAIFTNQGSSTLNLSVQDLDGTPLSHEFLGALNNTTVVRVVAVSPAEDLQAYVRDNSLSVALQIPADFQMSVIACKANASLCPVRIILYGDQSKSSFAVVQGVVNAVAEQMNFVISNTNQAIAPRVEPVISSNYTFMDFFLPGIVGMTVMTSTMYMMAGVCAEYRTRRYFKLLSTTTITKAEWLASKILWYVTVTVLSLLVTVGVGIALFGVHATINGPAVLLIGLGTLMFTSIGMLIGTAVRDPDSAVTVTNVIGFPMMFLSGTFWQLEGSPQYIQVIAQALPLTYLSNGLRDAMVYGNVGGVIFNTAVTAVLAAAFFVLAARLLSWKQA